METLLLKNGEHCFAFEVKLVMHALHTLYEAGIPGNIALYELAELCHDSRHVLYDGYAVRDQLERLALVEEDGAVRDGVRNIVLSSLSGEGLAMTLSSPV